MRTIIYIPMVHSPLECIAPELMHKMIRGKETAFFDAQERYWCGVENFLSHKRLDKMYNDGIFGSKKLVQECLDLMKETPTPYGSLVKKLAENGVTYMRTESLFTTVVCTALYLKTANPKYMEKRDRYMARQINKTLRPGETGVLFMGAAHGVDVLMDASISVERYDAGLEELLNIVYTKEQLKKFLNRNSSASLRRTGGRVPA